MEGGLRRSILMMNMLVVVVVLFVGLMWGAIRVDGLTGGECKEEKRKLVSACQLLIYKRPPDANCCERLRVSHVECICPAVTPSRAALIDVNYAVKVVRGCGRPVPRHFKCGSITTP